MIIVSGRLSVHPSERDAYLETCRDVVATARATDGCLDFALSPDLLDAGRVNILERWATREALDAFRGDGVGEDQGSRILAAEVIEADVADVRTLG